MKIEKIKPIPKYILSEIEKIDKRANHKPCGQVRFYAYLSKNDGELVKITVAVKEYKRKWYCKQVAVHGLHSAECFCRDMEYSYMGGYTVGWYAEGITASPRYWEDGKWYKADDKYYNPFSHLINPEYAYLVPGFQYSACELYKGDDLLSYLRIYEKYPIAEMLVKLGLSRYTESKQILEKASKDKSFRKYLGRNRDTLATKICYIHSILTAYKQNKSLESVQAFEELKKDINRYRSVKEIAKEDFDRFSNYITKQKIGLASYADYLRACEYLNLDMALDLNRFPHDFNHFHDLRIAEMRTDLALKDEQRRKEAEEEKKHLVENFLTVSSKYMPLQSLSNGAYVVFIAQSPAELIREGEALHHCVGRMGYDRKFAREQSLIFFIRSATDTDTPLATIEFDPKHKKVLQCYADHNSTPDKSVMTFVNDIWLPHANKALKKIAA